MKGVQGTPDWAKERVENSPVFKEAANRSATSDGEYQIFMDEFAQELRQAYALGAAQWEGQSVKSTTNLSTQATLTICKHRWYYNKGYEFICSSCGASCDTLEFMPKQSTQT